MGRAYMHLPSRLRGILTANLCNFVKAEAIRTTVVSITNIIHTKVVQIAAVICTTKKIYN